MKFIIQMKGMLQDGGTAGAFGFYGDGRSGAADAERPRSRRTRQRDDAVRRPYIPYAGR